MSPTLFTFHAYAAATPCYDAIRYAIVDVVTIDFFMPAMPDALFSADDDATPICRLIFDLRFRHYI